MPATYLAVPMVINLIGTATTPGSGARVVVPGLFAVLAVTGTVGLWIATLVPASGFTSRCRTLTIVCLGFRLLAAAPMVLILIGGSIQSLTLALIQHVGIWRQIAAWWSCLGPTAIAIHFMSRHEVPGAFNNPLER
jgi:hypothetical protein